jgi:hypothetical protein
MNYRIIFSCSPSELRRWWPRIIGTTELLDFVYSFDINCNRIAAAL